MTKLAAELASQPYAEPGNAVPDYLRELDYDQLQKIHFRPKRALWANERLFQIQMFHLGFLYHQPIRINIVENEQILSIPFRRELFDYSDLGLPDDMPSDLGFAGFRIHYPLHSPMRADEVAVFLGASYFRILGRGQAFGSSARGLAVDTAQPGGEEFPVFKEFWLMAPEPDASQMIVYALLDGSRVTGAYRFHFDPGTETVVEVTARIFSRETIDKLGIAPLNGMYFLGENTLRRVEDFRPEIHNTDGLLMLNGAKEWIWRPLSNPSKLRASAFIDENPRGFGLMQRDRDFASYLDLDANYDERSSLWVEPIGDWGRGHVELIEIPTDDETNDNIVAFWIPERQISPGETLNFQYRLHAQLKNDLGPALGRSMLTRIGSRNLPGNIDQFPPDSQHFVIDFYGGDLSLLGPTQPVEMTLNHSSGRVLNKIVVHNPKTHGWRVEFRFDPEGGDDIDLKLYLTLRGQRITESWTYLWSRSIAER